MDKRIIVGLSGGVDSSISLVLLKKQGWKPIGVSLKLPVWKSKNNILRENICCTSQSLATAKKICKQLRTPFNIFDVRRDFQKEVVDYFVSQIRKAKTPNPCVICNRQLKFKKLFEFSRKAGAEYIATGHYARKRFNRKTQKWELLMAKDSNKDQSYSLSFLPQRWLKYVVFPLGDYTKQSVYSMAKQEGFDFFLKKKQSQDFCFVAGKSIPEFLKNKIGIKRGMIIDKEGNLLGSHQGLHFYTIGQRKRINLAGGPYFVKGIDFKNNYLIVTPNKNEVSQRQLFLAPFNVISGEKITHPRKVMAKLRYRQALQPATLYPAGEKKVRIVFETPVFAAAPGQVCVWYKNEVCLGGGVII